MQHMMNRDFGKIGPSIFEANFSLILHIEDTQGVMMNTHWSSELQQLTRETLHNLDIFPLDVIRFKNIDGRFASANVDQLCSGEYCLLITRGDIVQLDSVDVLIEQGWCID
ncbi:hypothetical protein [uncultured Deefgea sp.]|uniref:hypothetical protein n=1 Tax=uncultured Deefgea sp. TaxID=1304914 RepID=UPI0026066F8F|nr:hypothetical protein [uncultured Deefgea sp.]